MTEALATVLFWYGVAGLFIFFGGLFIAWLFDGRTSGAGVLRKANRELNKRPRLFKTLRFWNF